MNRLKKYIKSYLLFLVSLLTVFIVSSCQTQKDNFAMPPLPPEPQEEIGFALGTNLSSVTNYSTQYPLIDYFKMSKLWITQGNKKWDTQEQDKLDLDENGWVKSLPKNGEAEYTIVTATMAVYGYYPKGKYLVLYDGQGTITYGFDAKKIPQESVIGRDVIEVVKPKRGMLLSITETDPNNTGDYIRNIRVIEEKYELTYKKQIFNPLFIEKITPFKAFRFMDFMSTNNSTQTTWDKRPKMTNATYFSDNGVPLEVMIELANKQNANPWFNIPHKADDEYIRNFAQYVKDNLKPNLTIYVEFSNEIWNRANRDKYSYVRQQAMQMFPNLGEIEAVIDWYSKRTTEVMRIWDEVFDTDKDRVIGVMSGRLRSVRDSIRALNYVWAGSKKPTHKEMGIDAIAVNAYIDGYVGKENFQDQVKLWTKEPDGGLSKFFLETLQGGVLNGGYKTGMLGSTLDLLDKFVALGKQENLPIVAYEGGQHFVGVRKVAEDKDITNLFMSANREPRMGEVYTKLLTEWKNRNLGIFMHFSSVGLPSKFGSWGALEHLEQETSPKYQALIDFIKQNSHEK